MTSPDSAWKLPRARRIGGAGSRPVICGGIVSAARVEKQVLLEVVPTPHNHLTPSPDGRVSNPSVGRVGRAGFEPTIRGWVISRACIHVVAVAVTSPYDHFIAGPYCGMA